MNCPNKIVDVAKLALKPIELRIDSRLILLALLVGACMYFSHKDARQQRIETVYAYASGPHRINVIDSAKDGFGWYLYKDSVTDATIFCAGAVGISCFILPPDKAK